MSSLCHYPGGLSKENLAPLFRTQLNNTSLIQRLLLWQPPVPATEWRNKLEVGKGLPEVTIDVSMHTVKFAGCSHKRMFLEANSLYFRLVLTSIFIVFVTTASESE